MRLSYSSSSNEKNMMRKILFALLAVLAFAGCSSDPVLRGMTTQQKESYAKAIAGEYAGTYIIIYGDGAGGMKTVKIANSQMSVTDLTLHSVCFRRFPVCQLSHVVMDGALAEALAGAADVDFMADYRFYDLQDNGDVNWGFEPAAIPLTLHYGGADHHLMLKLSSSNYFQLQKASIDAGQPFAERGVFQFAVVGIYEGDTLLQEFDGVWQDTQREFLVYFQLDKE